MFYSFFCFNSSVCVRIFLLYLLLLHSIVIFYFSIHSCGVVAFSLPSLHFKPLYIVCTVQLNELTIYSSLYGPHEDLSSRPFPLSSAYGSCGVLFCSCSLTCMTFILLHLHIHKPLHVLRTCDLGESSSAYIHFLA